MAKRRALHGRTVDELFEDLKEFENVSVPKRATPPAPPPPDKCKVEAGGDVENWEGRLTPSQCAKLPPGKLLGQGAFASAYEHATDPTKVVKFTADKEDAVTSARLQGKNLARAVRVFDVVKLKGQKATAPVMTRSSRIDFKRKNDQPVFGIMTERLDGLNAAQEAAANAFHRAYTRRESYDPNATSTRELARQADPRSFYIADYLDPFPIEEDCKRRAGKAGNACTRYIDEIYEAVDEVAHEVGVIPLDLHSGNWGVKPDGKMAILDMGVSAGKEKSPRIKLLAGVKKARARRKK